MGERWLITDEADDVAGSIRHALRNLPYIADDAQTWKWIALALHSALQGACVCHLTTTAAPVGAVTPANAAEWISHFEERRADYNAKRPRTHLLRLPDLLKAIRKPHSAGDRSNNHGVEISDAELNWLSRFHDSVRNQLVHFRPMSWSLEVSGIPAIAQLTSRIVGDIAELGWAFRHKDRLWREALQRGLTELAAAR